MSAATQSHQPAKLKFTDHLMFNAVLTENEDLCRGLIGAVLGKHVEKIEYLDDEHVIQPDIDGHGARLDVLALIDGNYVDVEMQVGRKPDIARRCRFYHSAIASRYTPKGSDYRKVPTSYVIFICLNDPLGAGRPRYELATRCTNSPTTVVDDGAFSILLNASAWEQEENPEVAGMLHYASTGQFTEGLAERLAKAVDDKNLDRKWVKASMGIMSYEHEIRVLSHELEDIQAEIGHKNAEIDQKSAELEQKKGELERKKGELERKVTELEQKIAELRQKDVELEQKDVELKRKDVELKQKDVELERKDVELERKDVELDAANAKNEILKDLLKRLASGEQVDLDSISLDDPDLMELLRKRNENA